ncbi:MAG TPA: glycosyltransferase family 9 protein, partial [Myxococcales bacterium]|nr:glycosyltransferase family 9 protein [Myxococcales bacterium]
SRYEVVIDAAHWHAFSTTSALVSRWAASRWVIGSQRGPADIYSRAVPPPADGTPEVEAKLDLARALGLHVSAQPMETALGLRTPWPAREPFVALNPGARKLDHRLPPERFAALARALPLKSVVFWGPGEEELARKVGAELAPPTNLEQLASAFRAARLVVTNDTGPMHLAVACGAPVLALFKNGAGLRWAHPGPRFRAIVEPAGDAAVLAAARQLLDTAGGAAEPPSP